MKTSLIVPVYNEEKILPQFFDSVLKQNLPIDEVIICNNASTDNSLKVIAQYKNKLTLIIVNEPQKGIRYAVEAARLVATGDIILRTDADCILPSNWSKNICRHFSNDSELAALGGIFFAHDGNFFIKLLTPIVSEISRLIFRIARGHQLFFGGNFAIRNKILKKINGFHTPEEYIQEDILISRKIVGNKYKARIFIDCWNYTSTRRFVGLSVAIKMFLSGISSKHYVEKIT